MMDKNTGYVPLVSPYGSNISFGGEQDSYWEQTTYLQNDIQPAHSAPFFQSQRDFMPNQGSQKSITATDFASHHYQPYPTGMSNTTYAPTSSTLPQRTEATKRYREPPAKRQRTSALTQPILGSCSTAIFDTDQASICESASDCCTSCSGDDICDEPDCQPCDEPACVEAVEICSQESCSKPACQDECLSTAFRVQGSLGHSEILPEIIESKDGPWSSQLVRHDPSRTRESTHTRGNSAVDHSYLPTPPSVVDNSETPASPYLPTPQSNTFGQHASYYQESPADLSGAGAIFNGTEDQWADASYTYDLNAPEVIPCNWEGCNVVCGSHNDWISHFHEVHIDPQMSFGCPIPQENCPPTMSINPIDHLQTVHGYNFDFSAGALSCPATTCPPEQTYYNPIAFHNHLDHYHATPVHGSLQCKLPTCGTEFDDPNQFFTHMSNHLHPFVPKEEEDIDLLTPPVSTGRISTGLEKVEVSADSDLPHLCKWKSKNEGICSHECKSASDLQDHIKNQHLTPLSKSTGYICQWEGCLRDSNLGEKAGFSQRGKLDRHMATHTGCKYTSDVI